MVSWFSKAVAVAALATSLNVTAQEANSVTSTSTNYVSNAVLTKGWKRSFVLGQEGGKLLDPSGTLAEYVTAETISSVASNTYLITTGAHQGMTNGLQRLAGVTNNIVKPDGHVYIAGALEQPMTDYHNLYCFIAGNRYDKVEKADYLDVWFSRELEDPPQMGFNYRSANDTQFRTGEWLGWGEAIDVTCGDTTYYTCYTLKVRRPDDMTNLLMRVNEYPTFGRPGAAFSFGNSVFYITDDSHSVSNIPWTGVVTNQTKIYYPEGTSSNLTVRQVFENGVFLGEEVLHD